MIRSFLLQLGLYTTLYSSVHLWDEESYQKGLGFVPLIGLLLGGILYGSTYVFPYQFQAFFLVLLYVVLTGGLHMDGFGDTLDGLLARRGREEALRIMKDPHLGSFGLLGLVLLLLGYYSFLPGTGKLLLLLPAQGRLCSMLAAYHKDYARDQGMGKYFVEGIKLFPLVVWSILLAGLYYYLGQLGALLVFLLSLLFSLFLGKFFQSKLGGLTGDTIGFTIEMAQLFYIVVFSLVEALWI